VSYLPSFPVKEDRLTLLVYSLASTNFITHVNNKPTPDLDAFLREVKKIGDNEYFRLKVMTFDNVPWVATMKKNEHYFPTSST
jgi:pro-apoptotic serine protease NMA111